MRSVRSIAVLLSIFFGLVRCTDGYQADEQTQGPDTIAPFIVLRGAASDTAYMFTRYVDPGVSVWEGAGAERRCPSEPATVVVSGTVDTHLPGTYELIYDAYDKAGNKASPLKRKVAVVEHRANSMAGNYNVVCTCTAIAKSGASTFTTSNYTTTLHPAPVRDQVELTILNTGGEDVSPAVILGQENKVDVHYYTRNMHRASGGTGTLSPASHSFTLETVAYQYEPDITYRCSQLFTKQLILAESKSSHKTMAQAK